MFQIQFEAHTEYLLRLDKKDDSYNNALLFSNIIHSYIRIGHLILLTAIKFGLILDRCNSEFQIYQMLKPLRFQVNLLLWREQKYDLNISDAEFKYSVSIVILVPYIAGLK